MHRLEESNEESSNAKWYWQESSFAYVPYDEETNAVLEAAYQRKDNNLQIKLLNRRYLVELNNWVQKRVRTEAIRNVRRISRVAPGTHGWFYLKDNEYHPYDAQNSEMVERAYLSNCPSWSLIIKTVPYEIEFKTMQQQNMWTKFKRKVVRKMLGEEGTEELKKSKEAKVNPASNEKINDISSLQNSSPVITDDNSIITCKICCCEPQGVIFLPCGHLGACKNCASRLKSCCPFCNEPYTQILDVYQP